MFEWFFAPETSRVLLTTILGGGAAIISAFIASHNVSKTIRNQNKGLPPEILRVEKIQSILTEHLDNTTLSGYDSKPLLAEYERSMKKLFLESKILDINVADDFARLKLLRLPENISSSQRFPDLKVIHGSRLDQTSRVLGLTAAIIGVAILALSIFATLATFASLFRGEIEFFWGMIFILLLLVFIGIIILTAARTMTGRWSILEIETDLIVRNIYQTNTEFFTGKKIIVRENVEESKKRLRFENSRKYKKWLKDNPTSNSWNYGFSSNQTTLTINSSRFLPEGYYVESNKFVFKPNFPFFGTGKKLIKNSNKTSLDIEYHI